MTGTVRLVVLGAILAVAPLMWRAYLHRHRGLPARQSLIDSITADATALGVVVIGGAAAVAGLATLARTPGKLPPGALALSAGTPLLGGSLLAGFLAHLQGLPGAIVVAFGALACAALVVVLKPRKAGRPHFP